MTVNDPKRVRTRTAKAIVVATAVVGALSGPWTFRYLSAVRPAITWGDLAIGLLLPFFVLVLLVHALDWLKQVRGVIYVWGFFSVSSLLCLTSRFVSMGYAEVTEARSPAAFLLFVIAVGMSLGNTVTKSLFRSNLAVISPSS